MKIISKSQSVRFGSLLTGAVALLAFGTANAQWNFEPVVKVGGERDDNATLSIRTDDVLDVSGLLADISVRVDYQSALSRFYVTPRLVSRNYKDNPEIDSDDIFVKSEYSYSGQSSDFRIRFDFDEQSVRTAERSDADLDVDDPGDIPDDDTGFVSLQDDRRRIRVAPRWNYRFSDATSGSIDLNYLDTSYADALQLVLNDFTDIRLRLGLNRVFSDRTIGRFLVTGRKYELSDGSSDADGVGAMVGFDRLLSPTTTFRFMVGVEDTDSSISQADPALIADISLRQRLETVNILALYRRSVSASGAGKLSVRDQVSLNLSRLLSEKITAGIGARMYQTNSLDNVVTIDERNYVQLRAQLIWNMTRNFATEFDYRYTFQKRSALGESSNSNQINIWFVYQPNSIDRRFARR